MTFKWFGRQKAQGKTHRRVNAGYGISAAFLLGLILIKSAPAPAATNWTDPVIAEYDGGRVTFTELETYSREMPLAQRVPFARNVGHWRRMMAGELAKMTALTSQAKTAGFHQEPGYLRARDYFINEYLCYLVVRNHLNNRIDLSAAAQQKEYETNRADYWASATVTLRMIRSRDSDALTSAAAAIAAGQDFRTVEMSVSQVSPRSRGTILGPYPTTEQRTAIPPPDFVINTAMAMNEGQTTGPFELNGFHYIVKTEKKTEGRQLSRTEVAERLEARLRERQMNQMVPQLVDRIQRELGAEVNEALFASPRTNPNDILATAGAVRITRKEFTDLNGAVRGPAAFIATGMTTPLKRFVLPYMMAEWARAQGYLELPETHRAIKFYELQHLSGKMEMELGEKLSPLPTDEELRARFQKNINEYRRPGAPEPRFEDHKHDLLSIAVQAQAPEAGRLVSAHVLSKLNFRMEDHPGYQHITAYEAVRAASDRLTSDVRLLEISPVKLPEDGPDGSTPYHDFGRAPHWRIVFQTADGVTTNVQVHGPATLLHGEEDYNKIPALSPWLKLWRFDTDSLKRHAIDKELGDFIARYDNRVRVAARVDFSYSADDPTSPTGSRIIYSVVPTDPAKRDGFEVVYSGETGDAEHRAYGYDERRCLTCGNGENSETSPGETSGTATVIKRPE